MTYNMWGFGLMGWFGMLFWIAFWIFVIWFIIKLISGRVWEKQDPLEIAKARYAKGEITKKEYEEIRKELKK